MKHLLIFTLLFSFSPKPAKADLGITAAIGIGIMTGLIVGDYFNKDKEKKEDEKECDK
jgi:hypothetical protein